MSMRGRSAKAISSAPAARFLVVTVGGTHLALHADCVRGLLTLEEASSAEALTVQGVTYVCIDLSARLQLGIVADGSETRLVLLSNGERSGHIRVGEVHGLKELEQVQVLPLPKHFKGEERSWYQGMLLFEESVALVLDPAWLMEGCGSNHALEVIGRNFGRSPLLPAPSTMWDGPV